MKYSVALLFFLSSCVIASFAAGGLPLKLQQDPGLLESMAEKIGEPCPESWDHFINHCYLVSGTIQTQSAARTHCGSVGGGLVKINSQVENEFVLEIVNKRVPSLKLIWIGLKWDAPGNGFYWLDNSVPVYKNWAPNEPNGKAVEPCASMYTKSTGTLPFHASGYWNDLPCPNSTRLGFVCKKLQP